MRLRGVGVCISRRMRAGLAVSMSASSVPAEDERHR